MFVHVECYLILELRIWSVSFTLNNIHVDYEQDNKLHVKHWKNKTKKKHQKKNKQKNAQKTNKKTKKQPNRHKKEGFVGQRNSMESRNYMNIDKLDLGRYITTSIKVHCIQN